jgi:hypothetical protein
MPGIRYCGTESTHELPPSLRLGKFVRALAGIGQVHRNGLHVADHILDHVGNVKHRPFGADHAVTCAAGILHAATVAGIRSPQMTWDPRPPVA